MHSYHSIYQWHNNYIIYNIYIYIFINFIYLFIFINFIYLNNDMFKALNYKPWTVSYTKAHQSGVISWHIRRHKTRTKKCNIEHLPNIKLNDTFSSPTLRSCPCKHRIPFHRNIRNVERKRKKYLSHDNEIEVPLVSKNLYAEAVFNLASLLFLHVGRKQVSIHGHYRCWSEEKNLAHVWKCTLAVSSQDISCYGQQIV